MVAIFLSLLKFFSINCLNQHQIVWSQICIDLLLQQDGAWSKPQRLQAFCYGIHNMDHTQQYNLDYTQLFWIILNSFKFYSIHLSHNHFIVSSFAFPFLKSLKEALIGDKVIWKIGLASLGFSPGKGPSCKICSDEQNSFS